MYNELVVPEIRTDEDKHGGNLSLKAWPTREQKRKERHSKNISELRNKYNYDGDEE